MPAYRSWVVSASADLISSGANDDDWAPPPELFDACEKAFGVLLKTRCRKLPDMGDIQEAINTSMGRVIDAYVIFSLRKAPHL